MPLDDLHRDVASVALGAASEHGFILGGGNALIAHGIINRPTEDVDLVTDNEHGVRAASDAVESALARAGYRAERQDKSTGLDDVFAGLDEEMAEGLAEWIVTAPGGRQMSLQMAYFERSREPVVMEFGPVQDLEDALGHKTAALATRAYERDYSDVAHAMQRYSTDELIGFARRADPGLTGEDFADAGRRLDRLSDTRLVHTGMTLEDVAMIRERFADWPREVAEPGAGHAEEQADRPPQLGQDPGRSATAPPDEAARPHRAGLTADQIYARLDRAGPQSGAHQPGPGRGAERDLEAGQ